MSGLTYIALGLYLIILSILCALGLHRLLMTLRFVRTRGRAPSLAVPAALPRITVQLPLYNERYVAERLLDAIAALDYPRALLEVQVLDDSTDDTVEVVDNAVAQLQNRGLTVAHMRRPVREGFKAGALAWGLDRTSSELVAIFDADFVPPPAFLKQLVPHFADPEVGMVQARWTHLNRRFSALTAAQGVLLDGHFIIEHAARYQTGCMFNFNGTAGIWRRRAIEEAGGWQGDTLTEDLDLSYRSQLKGWRFVYRGDVLVPAEVPVEAAGFRNQQFRWAKGSIQTAVKLLPRLLKADLPRHVRFEACAHLLANLAYPLMLGMTVLLPLAAWLRPELGLWGTLLVDLPLMMLALGSVSVFYGVSQAAQEDFSWPDMANIPLALALGAALSVSNTRGVIEGLMGKPSEFVRTPKYAVVGRRDIPQAKGYSAGSDWTPWVEMLMGVHLLLGACAAVARGHWASAPLLLLLAWGFSYLGGLSLWQSRLARPGDRTTPRLPAQQSRRTQPSAPTAAPARPQS